MRRRKLTHMPHGATAASYDGRGSRKWTPTPVAGSFSLVAEVLGGVGLLARRGLVPDPRQESPDAATPTPTLDHRLAAPALPRRGRGVPGRLVSPGMAFDVPYDGVHQPSENARQCRTCRVMTTWPHLFCSACTTTEADTGCSRCQPT